MDYSRTDSNHATLFSVRGVLDALAMPELRAIIDRLVYDERHEITIDLSGLRGIDGPGLNALVSLHERVNATGGAVRFIGVTTRPALVLRLLRRMVLGSGLLDA